MKPHKWAKEIIAWANGAEIEYRSKELTMNEISWTKWESVGSHTQPPAFFSDDDFEYRIKPQPKEPQYLYVYGNGYVTCTSIEKADNCGGVPYIGKIKLEADDE